MGIRKENTSEFFDNTSFDAVNTATGSLKESRQNRAKKTTADKRKAGFYLSSKILDRFNRKFYELKLEGVSIENKSTLLEIALSFALDDIDRGEDSQVLTRL